MKTCTRCQLKKSFYMFSTGQNWCKDCYKKYQAERIAFVTILEEGEKTCRICCEIKSVQEFSIRRSMSDGRNNECRPCNNMKQNSSRLGISISLYKELVDKGCGICGGNEGELHIDHDHSCCPGRRSCGKCIRAALCEKHNIGLGCFRDDPEMLRQAAQYLESF